MGSGILLRKVGMSGDKVKVTAHTKEELDCTKDLVTRALGIKQMCVCVCAL